MGTEKQVRATVIEHNLFSRGEKVVVAVSGGPDSLTMLHILRELSAEFEITLHVAHLNHKLRGQDSEEDAAFVADTARSYGIPSTIEERPVADYGRMNHLSIEDAARTVRYRFLAEVAYHIGAQTVAVGHNADDQVETVVMHWLRGSGIAGLRGMTYKSPMPPLAVEGAGTGESMMLVRPLLDIGRNEIEAFCLESGITPRLDNSNFDMRFYRNRVRREIIPYLEQINPSLRKVLRHSARSIGDDYEYLRGVTMEAFEDVLAPDHSALPPGHLARFVFEREKWRNLPPSLQRATLREAVKRLRKGLRNINWTHIEEARHIALEKRVGAEATLPQGIVLVVGYDDLTIGETVSLPDIPLLHGSELEVRPGSKFDLPESSWEISLKEDLETFSVQEPEISPDLGLGWAVRIDADKIKGIMRLRTRRAGERFEPMGLGGRHKSLHEFMIAEKIPRYARDLLPILVDEEKIVWVCGYRVDERVMPTEETRHLLTIKFFRTVD